MSHSVDAPLPSSGRSVRVDLLGVQWLLERSPEGVRCLASEGEPVHDAILGLPEEGGFLRFECRPPEHAIELAIDTNVTLAPGGRVTGYFALPLDLCLCFVSERARAELVLLRHRELRTGWRDGEGYFHPWRSPLHAKPRAREGRCLWLRLFARNGRNDALELTLLRLALAGHGVQVLRGFAIGPAVFWRAGRDPRLRPLPRFRDRGASPMPSRLRQLGES